MSPIGPSRHFAAARQFGRFRTEADIGPDFMSTRPMKLRISFFSDPSGANALPLPLAYRNAEFDSVERAREIAIADATRPGANAHSIIIESVDGGTISER